MIDSIAPLRPNESTHSPALHKAADRHRLHRGVVCLVLDLVVLSIAFCLAFWFRFEGAPPPRMMEVMLITLPAVITLQYALLVWQQVPRFSWSFIGVRDLPAIAKALVAAAAVLIGLRYGCALLVEDLPQLFLVMIPVSVIVCDCSLALLGLTGSRCVRRLLRERKRHRQTAGKEPTRAILVGAGTAGKLLLQELSDSGDLGLQPVAFVDDDRNKVGVMLGGIRVAGTTADLAAITKQYGAKVALISIATPDGGSVHRIVESCRNAGLQTKIVPPVQDIVSGRVRISSLRDVAIEDLLGREQVVIERSAAPEAVAGKVVMVTGAGGSIGSELCRQILKLRPRILVLVERTENSLYEIHRELARSEKERGEKEPVRADKGVRVEPELADVGDLPRMDYLFQAYRPHVVFHAAAHKHVPMMECVPGEAIKNNVFGTKTVADLADKYRAERFVLVSTDKAVLPSSVMGATKRLAELYVKDLDARSETRYVSVRFGNVMGSAGSVIPLFREQIAKGGPVTVTHPEMERFFMTIPEASRLVLEAAGLCKGGEVMLLDMGNPVKIRHLAEQMIRLSGLRPGVDIEIVYTGVRPGEKLQEELVTAEEHIEETDCKKLFVWRGNSPALSMSVVLERLQHPGRTPEEIRATLNLLLPEYSRMQVVWSA